MLVRKLKCRACGAAKINEINTGFIYCDYCAHFMGYDFEKISEEATDVYDYEYFSEHGKWPPKVQTYMDLLQEIGPAIERKDATAYIDLSVKLLDTQMDLFPRTYSPKVKIHDYRTKYLHFYHKFLAERNSKGVLFPDPKDGERFAELQSRITQEMVNHQPKWQYDEHLEAYFDAISDFSKKSSDQMMEYDCLQYYPEEVDEGYSEIIYKQTIYGYTKLLDKETFKKVTEYLGLQTEYEDLAPPEMEVRDCGGCGHPLNVPSGAEKMICESCGNLNLLQTGKITCMNCGAGMSVDEAKNKNECDYCGSQNKVVQF